LIDDWDIDLIYTNSSVIGLGRLAAIIKGLPHIWHIREFGDLDFNLSFQFPKWLSLKFIKSSSAVICNSTTVKDYYFNPLKNKHIHVVYNGIAARKEFIKYKSARSNLDREKTFTFVIMGAISPKKGQETAIRAIADLKRKGLNTYLIVAGSGNEKFVEYLKRLVITLGISEDVEFTGFVEDPYEVYFKSDCLLMCSVYEAFGRVTAEGMSACLPVIGKNSGGTPEIVVEGETGLLYNNFDELVDCMEKIQNNPDWGKQMGINGWNRAKKYFSIEDYAANVYEIIQSVMK